MALFKINRGNSTNLPTAMTDGWAYFCTDTAEFFIDYSDANGVLHRAKLNAKEAESLTGYDIATVLNSSDVEIPTSKAILNALNVQSEQLNTSLANSKADWNEEDESSLSYIQNKPAEMTEDDMLELLVELGAVDPVSTIDNIIYTNSSDQIYIL